MRIAYCSTLRLPSERAYGHQVARVCDAMAALGHEITVFSPFRKNPVAQDYWSYHGADRRVQLRTLGQFDPIDRWFLPGPTGSLVLTARFGQLLRSAIRKEHVDLLYTRSPGLLRWLLRIGTPVVVELHRLPGRGQASFAAHCKRCRLIVCLTAAMCDELVSWGVPSQSILVEGDAVEEQWMQLRLDRQQERARWGVPGGMFVLGYAGSLETMGLSKGVQQIIDALSLLRAEGRQVHGIVAGGPPPPPGALGKDVTYVGQIAHADVPSVLSASDALVYCAPKSQDPYFLRDTSPLKLFEYMASGRPIIAADLPPVREILSQQTAMFYEAGNAASLAAAARQLMAHPQEAAERAQTALQTVGTHTWSLRMQRILARAQAS